MKCVLVDDCSGSDSAQYNTAEYRIPRTVTLRGSSTCNSVSNVHNMYLRDVKEGRCFTSLWAVQNTHMFYLEDKDYEQIQDQLQKKQEIELLTYLRKVPAFKVLRY